MKTKFLVTALSQRRENKVMDKININKTITTLAALIAGNGGLSLILGQELVSAPELLLH
jgi:hypothetical protein